MIVRYRDMMTLGWNGLARRRYLLGAVLAWALILSLTSSSVPRALHRARPAVTPAAAPGAASALAGFPNFSAPATAPFASAPPFAPFAAPAFGPPPTPPTVSQLSCPYDIPQAQSAPLSPGAILSFVSPLMDLSGPFAVYDIPTLGAIGPLVPIVTPLVSLSQPVMNEVTPNMTTVITDIVTLEDDAGLDSPQGQQYAQQFEPYWISLLTSLTPTEQALTSTTAAQCLVLFENYAAQEGAAANITLPQLPLLPLGLPGSSPGSASVAQAAMSMSAQHPFTQLVLPSSGGVPAAVVTAARDLSAGRIPVEIDLVDDPAPGQTLGGTAFADFVALAVHALPGVSAFEVDVPGANPAAPAAIGDLVHGLAAADAERQPGQLIGLGVEPGAMGNGAAAFWPAFDTSMKGYQPIMVDFGAADLTSGPSSSLAAQCAQAASAARALEGAWTSLGGVPADVPLFATVGLFGAPSDVSSVRHQIAAYETALSGLHVGMLGVAPQ